MAVAATVTQEVSLAAWVGQPAGGLRQAGEKGRLGTGEGCGHGHVAFTRSGDQDPPTASGAQRGSE